MQNTSEVKPLLRREFQGRVDSRIESQSLIWLTELWVKQLNHSFEPEDF